MSRRGIRGCRAGFSLSLPLPLSGKVFEFLHDWEAMRGHRRICFWGCAPGDV